MLRKLAVTYVVMLLALAACVANAYGSYSGAFLYSAFNSATITWKELDQNYTAFEVKISNYITYNTTTAGSISIDLGDNNGSLTGQKTLELTFAYTNNVLTLKYFDHSASSITLATGHWSSTPTILTYENQKLSLGTPENKTAILDHFALGDFTLRYIGVSGAQFTATNGYVQYEVKTSLTGTASQWIPIVLSFALLGICLSFLRRFT